MLDFMSVSQFRGVYTGRFYPNGTEHRGYNVTPSSKERIERIINSGKYKINIQIRNHHGQPAPIIFIRK